MIFEPSERNLNLNAWDCRASKIIPNDTKLEPISWDPVFGNPIFNFCVGGGVGGHDYSFIFYNEYSFHLVGLKYQYGRFKVAEIIKLSVTLWLNRPFWTYVGHFEIGHFEYRYFCKICSHTKNFWEQCLFLNAVFPEWSWMKHVFEWIKLFIYASLDLLQSRISGVFLESNWGFIKL